MKVLTTLLPYYLLAENQILTIKVDFLFTVWRDTERGKRYTHAHRLFCVWKTESYPYRFPFFKVHPKGTLYRSVLVSANQNWRKQNVSFLKVIFVYKMKIFRSITKQVEIVLTQFTVPFQNRVPLSTYRFPLYREEEIHL